MSFAQRERARRAAGKALFATALFATALVATAYDAARGREAYATEPAGSSPSAPPRVPAGALWVPGATLVPGPRGTGGAPAPSARPVELEGFALDRTEVTVGAYEACVRAGACAAPVDPYGALRDRALPVAGVRYEDAVAYCRRAGGRLPTEHEWELAARGPERRTYPWGERVPDCSLAQHAGCAPRGARPVGRAVAGRGPYGHDDLAGNVAEWVADDASRSARASARGADAGADARRSDAGATAPPSARDAGAEAGADARRSGPHGTRGGAYDSAPAALASAARVARDGDEARYDTGFRCAYDPAR